MTELRVHVADAAVAQGDALISTIGLGSCVAIVLYDAGSAVGGLAHILLPSAALAQDATNRAKFPGSAVPLLLERMAVLGARKTRVVAKLVGGASMFVALTPMGGVQIGERNVLASRATLAEHGIPVVAQDVGGGHGRSVYFHVSSGTVEVRSMVRGNVHI